MHRFSLREKKTSDIKSDLNLVTSINDEFDRYVVSLKGNCTVQEYKRFDASIQPKEKKSDVKSDLNVVTSIN